MVDPLATDAPLTPAALYIKATIFVSAASCPVTVQDTVLVCGSKPTAILVGISMGSVVAFAAPGVGIKSGAGVAKAGSMADAFHEGTMVCQWSSGVAVKVTFAPLLTHPLVAGVVMPDGACMKVKAPVLRGGNTTLVVT